MSKITKRTKYCYTGGCVGRDMNFILVSMFVLPYIQHTMNLSIAQFSAVTTIMILARVWDAINDPMMGMLIENVVLKGGKFRPWIMIGGASNFFVTLLMFWIRPHGWAFVLFFAVIYISWGMTFTINDIAYHSLLPNLADSNESRNEMANLIQVFASIGQFIAGGLIPVLVTGNAIFMYRVVGLVVSCCFLLFTCITYFGVTERPVNRDQKNKLTLKKMFRIIWQNDQLIVAATGLLLYTVGIELFLSFAMNYVYFHFGYGGSYVMYFTVAFAIGTMVALALFSCLSKKFNRRILLTIALSTTAVGSLLVFIQGALIPIVVPLLFFAAFLVFLGNCLFYVVLTIYIANTIEYNAVRTGERREAVIASVRPFMSKLGAAIQQLIFSTVLILSGVYSYSQKVAELELEKSLGHVGEITEQANAILSGATEGMRLSIRIGMCIIPLILIYLGYRFVQKRYLITEEVFEGYVKELEERNMK